MGLVNIPIKPMLAISGQIRCDWGRFSPQDLSPFVNTPATPQVSWVKLKPGSVVQASALEVTLDGHLRARGGPAHQRWQRAARVHNGSTQLITLSYKKQNW